MACQVDHIPCGASFCLNILGTVLKKKYNKHISFVEFAQRQVVIQRVIDLKAQVKGLKSHNRSMNQQIETLGDTIQESNDKLQQRQL